MERKKDVLDKLVLFLAKRDGIDKLVKTLQYAGKLGHYRVGATNPELADRCKNLEVAAGLSRKAFRTGRFLTGFNALRTTQFPDRKQQVLSILGYGGEMVYWFFDHILWLSRVGVLPSHLANRMCFISAFGEAFSYVFFIASDLMLLRQGLQVEVQLKRTLQELRELQELQEFQEFEEDLVLKKKVQEVVSRISAVRMERVMCVMAIVANVSDLVIAMADVEPESVAANPVVLGVSGLASAWSGWYRNWPDS